MSEDGRSMTIEPSRKKSAKSKRSGNVLGDGSMVMRAKYLVSKEVR
jgi:hypothetical protein